MTPHTVVLLIGWGFLFLSVFWPKKWGGYVVRMVFSALALGVFVAEMVYSFVQKQRKEAQWCALFYIDMIRFFSMQVWKTNTTCQGGILQRCNVPPFFCQCMWNVVIVGGWWCWAEFCFFLAQPPTFYNKTYIRFFFN